MFNWFKSEFTAFHDWMVENVWKPSWTRFVTFMYGIPSAMIAAGSAVGQLAGDDKISQYLDKMHVPNYVFIGLAGIALVHYVAHGRD